MRKIKSFSDQSEPIFGGESSFLEPLMPACDFPDFESVPEARTFSSFFGQLMDETDNKIRVQHHQNILEKIRLKIPLMKNLEEYKNLYSKTFVRRKK